ncbi:MAG: two-component system, OmpR family, sensor histidine kinase MprB [Solirubrobacterales bacterium]|nr:two-component system, OmpR family, sensor histidine kinase MprB [Solirubrobacterales bacterium]
MSLRRRLALLSALAVAFAVLLASGLVYTLVRDRLTGDIDKDLRHQADVVSQRADQTGPVFFGSQEGALPAGSPSAGSAQAGVSVSGKKGQPAPLFGLQPPKGGKAPKSAQLRTGGGKFLRTAVPPPGPGAPPSIVQLLGPTGTVLNDTDSQLKIPVSATDRALATSGGSASFSDINDQGTPLRVLTQPLPTGGAIQVAHSLTDTNHTLDTLIIILAAVSAGGIALAAALGPFVARTALAPAGEVSDAAEEVARTHDLTHRIEVRGEDELGRLAASFNEMMAALERSEAAQRRLVADASHELRTPLATLRTNIETLGRTEKLDPDERKRLVADVTQELEEMTELVGDVVELARAPGQDAIARQDVALDELTRDAIERAQRRARDMHFEERLRPSIVNADPQRLGRAISNMLDNAGKWSPEGGKIDVEVGDGKVTVRDHGPGFPAADLDKVFDRFWRADDARGKPGSGLGLAIVQRVAEENEGAARASNAEDGGAVVSLELPEIDPDQPTET